MTLRASLLDFLLDRAAPAARWVRFERAAGSVTVRPRALARYERRIPFRRILKIHHRISAPLIRTETGAGGFAYYRSASDTSQIHLELRDSSAVPIHIRTFEQGGNSKALRESILEVQRIADEIAAVTECPMVIDFKEVECAFDLAEEKILFSGELLPPEIRGSSMSCRQVERMEVVETPTGFFSFTIYPRWGKPITTTRGHDRTNFLSDTVAMIAERANLFCRRVGTKDPSSESPEIPNVPIRPRLFGRAPLPRRRAGAGFYMLRFTNTATSSEAPPENP